MDNMKRVLIVTQGPAKEPFIHEMLFLFRSILRFGGSLADSQKIVYFTGNIDSSLKEIFSSMGVHVHIIEEEIKEIPHANKIQMLHFSDKEDFDYLVMLDTDVVIARDFSNFIGIEKVGCKIASVDPLGMELWKNLFEYFGLELPTERYKTALTMIETIPYFNSGVLIIPKKFVKSLYNIWKLYIFKMLEAYGELKEISQHRFFTDQIALALALVDCKIPHYTLPVEMNFTLRGPYPQDHNPEFIDPYIIHHHHETDSNGKILKCLHHTPNKAIDRVNSILD